MRKTELEKHLLDINNAKIPPVVMKKFWEFKNDLGTKPLGISFVKGIYYIVSPADDNFILWYTNMEAF